MTKVFMEESLFWLVVPESEPTMTGEPWCRWPDQEAHTFNFTQKAEAEREVGPGYKL